jgi:hypothetical protein
MRIFQRLLVADLSLPFDGEFLSYGAAVAKAVAGDVLVLTAAGAYGLREFAPAVKRTFAREEAPTPAIGVLPEPDLQTLSSSVSAAEADLLLLRYSSGSFRERELARRIVCEAPCSVWLVPDGYPPALQSVATLFECSDEGAALLESAAHVANALAARSLIAVHVSFAAAVLDPAPNSNAGDAAEELLNIYAFLRRVNLHGMPCDLHAEHGPYACRRLIEAAHASGANLVVIAAPHVSGAGFVLRRDGMGEYLAANLPVLALRNKSLANGTSRSTWRDLFALSEPTFG